MWRRPVANIWITTWTCVKSATGTCVKSTTGTCVSISWPFIHNLSFVKFFSCYPKSIVRFYYKYVNRTSNGFSSLLKFHRIYGCLNCVFCKINSILYRKMIKRNRIIGQNCPSFVHIVVNTLPSTSISPSHIAP